MIQMAMKSSILNIETLKTLCNYDGEKYIQKSGTDYINALGQVFPLSNNNDRPFTIDDVKKQPILSDFKFPGVSDYKYICKLSVKPLTITKEKGRVNEKIVPNDFVTKEAQKVFKKSLGITYLLTCVIDGKEHIIKIGSSRTTFSKRLGSYNCGTVSYWRTASTTNIKILQSMVTTRKDLNLYIYDCSEDYYVIVWHDVESVKFASPKALAVEDIMIKQFIEQFGFKPLANIQANATEVETFDD